MKLTIAQLNYKVADIKGNSKLIIDAINKAKQDKSELVIFSELSVCGYTPYDLLEKSSFIDSCLQAVSEIATHCVGITAIVGCPTFNNDDKGKKLYNSALVLQNGKCVKTVNKTLLPDYDIFDEYRFFERNKTFETIKIGNENIALTICEDLWNVNLAKYSYSKIYGDEPMQYLSKQNPTMIVNIAASPYSQQHKSIREDILQHNAKTYNIPLVYVNQVGANTDLIFGGNSMVINAKGEIVSQAKLFAEDIFTIDTRKTQPIAQIQQTEEGRIAEIHDALVLGIKDFFAKMNFKTATLGLSGGIDSAVVLALAEKALGAENIRVLLMPSQYSSDHSINDARALAENLHVQYDIVPINAMVQAFETGLSDVFEGTQPNVAEENIQARIRGSLLMALSNKFGHILLNTSNKSEAAVGYSTMYGDMNGALSVLGDVYKTDVFRLAKYINKDAEIIPYNTIVKPPSAELRPDQKDSDSLPDYDILDDILNKYLEENFTEDELINEGFEADTVKRILTLLKNSEYKRFQSPPILRVSSKAFGQGRKIPLVMSNSFF